MQVLLKDVTQKLITWLPNSSAGGLEASLRRGRKGGGVKGCTFGHPQAFIASLADELTSLSQSVYYVLERELLSLPDLQSSGGLRLLHALSMILLSEYVLFTLSSIRSIKYSHQGPEEAMRGLEEKKT